MWGRHDRPHTLPHRLRGGEVAAVTPGADVASLRGRRASRRGDMIFRSVTSLSGLLVFALLAAIAVFLVVKALPALRHDTVSFWTSKIWAGVDTTHAFGIAALLFGTVLTSILALVMA